MHGLCLHPFALRERDLSAAIRLITLPHQTGDTGAFLRAGHAIALGVSKDVE